MYTQTRVSSCNVHLSRITAGIFFVLQKTYQLSLLSAGSTIELVDAICTGKIQNGMAIIRSVINVLCCE